MNFVVAEKWEPCKRYNFSLLLQGSSINAGSGGPTDKSPGGKQDGQNLTQSKYICLQ